VTVVLVDAANVVGSRPDGWWRDRAGATTRLLDRLTGLLGRTVPGPDGTLLPVTAVVAVVEGAARDVGAPAGVLMRRAPGSGDDELAAAAAELAGALPGVGEEPDGDLLVVTADRGLRARLPAQVRVSGPGWLWATLDALP
jgi:hypothetical protein